jgi:hypothetical protein
MTGNIKGANIVRSLKQVLSAVQEQDDKFMILPLAGIGNHLCIGTDAPNYNEGTVQ